MCPSHQVLKRAFQVQQKLECFIFSRLRFFSSTLKKSKWFTSVTEMSVVFHWLKGALHFGNGINIRV